MATLDGMSLPPVPPVPPGPPGATPPPPGGFGPPQGGYGPPPPGEPDRSWPPEPARRKRGPLFAVLAVLVTAAAVLAVVLMASGKHGTGDEKAPKESGTSTTRSPRPSFSLPTELPSRLPSRLPTELPSGFPSTLPSDLESILPSLSDELP